MKLEGEIAQHETSQQEKIVGFMIYLSVFMGSSIVFFKEPFEGYFHYAIYLTLLPFFVSRYGLPKTPFQILVLPLLVGIFQIVLGNNEPFLFIKIFGGVLLSVSFYYYVNEFYEVDVEKMFKLYLTWTYWTAVIAIIQYLAFKINFKPGYDFGFLLNKGGHVITEGGGSIRVNSIYLEPSQLGIMLGPAAFVSALNILRRKHYHYAQYQNIVILIALYLSRSSTGYLGLFLIFLVMGINFGYFLYLVLFVVVGYFAAWGLYNTIPEFHDRVDSSMGLWVEGDLSLKNVNTSSFVLYNNSHIAWENLKEHPLFGTGLGSHPVAYKKFSYTNEGKIRLKGFEFNTADANSLLLRLMSETGLMGVLFILFLIFRGFIGYSGDEDDKYWIISGALLVLILLYLLRQGNYFLNGFPFFVWLYYYNKTAYMENEALKRLAAEEAERKKREQFRI
ncbi:MAG TPA: O-antigen ligase family protein [Bacteroidia bacterium]|jgi:hypothetical protein|nr:O-antigen ligase family protein [Bacteroidia bacterium]